MKEYTINMREDGSRIIAKSYWNPDKSYKAMKEKPYLFEKGMKIVDPWGMVVTISQVNKRPSVNGQAPQWTINVEENRNTYVYYEIAGIFVKELSKEEKVKYCRDNKIPIDEIELENPGLLHGKIAADMAKKEYNLPKEAQDAIIYHTTGRANMTIYDKILFVADSTSIDRKYENTDYFRHIAKKDLDEACIEILKFTIKDRVDEEKLLHINSVYALNYLLKEKNNK